MKLKNGANGS